jgi:alkanesulfonate monooxygenase SsuD/methylene tetrahydromethanopterin reductase-like flavin-dependent oxidoreductase (luciferase family)
VKTIWFHLMPYPALPEDFTQQHRSVWVDIDPALFDPAVAHVAYNDYIDELEHAATCGFDGVGVNEHHANAYGLMPSPNIVAAALARTCPDAAIVLLGNSVALYNPPLRVAEEMAMLDCITGGRLVAGFPVGTPMDTTFAYGQNPATLRERYHEGIELILRAWTEREVFTFSGKHHRLRYVNCWPRPIQQPHPPVWIPGSGSPETIEWVAQQRYTYMVLPTLAPYELRARTAEQFKAACERNGYTARHEQIGWGVGIYVAETDAKAVAEYEPHFWYYAKNLLRNRSTFNNPPGHASVQATLGVMEARRKARPGNFSTWEEIQKEGFVIVGSPATVRDRLKEIAERTGLGTLLPNFSVGNQPHELTRKSMELFAWEVMPALRDVNADAPAAPVAAR